jgi:translocation and assembly module TamB
MGSWRGQLAGGLSLAMPAADQLRLTLQASDRQRGHRLSARLQGPWRQPQLALQGQLQALRLPGSPARPVVVRADLALGLDPKPNVRLTQLQLRRGDASLEASGKLWPHLDVRSRRVTLGQELAAPLASLLGPEDSRRIQLQLLGPWQQPQINVQVQQHATSLLGPLELALRWRPGLLRLERLTTPELSASGELPLQPNRSGGLRPGNLLLSLDLRRFPLERLNALLGTRLQGDLQAWGEIRGPLTALQPDLELVVRNPGVGPLRLEETWQGHLHAAAGGGGLTLQALAPAAPGRLVARLDRRWLPLTLDLERGTGVLSLRGSPRHYSWNARRFPLQGLALAMTIGAAPQPVQGTLNGQGHLALQPLRTAATSAAGALGPPAATERLVAVAPVRPEWPLAGSAGQQRGPAAAGLPGRAPLEPDRSPPTVTAAGPAAAAGVAAGSLGTSATGRAGPGSGRTGDPGCKRHAQRSAGGPAGGTTAAPRCGERSHQRPDP